VRRLPKLLFELSSPERLNILLELQNKKEKLSNLSRKLNLTVTETSRHLQRLSEAKLIQKDPDANFTLTPFGTLTMSLLDGLGFASENREYFLEYDISGIPNQFIDRFGELTESTYVAEAFKNLAEGENRFREAQKLVWILSDQALASSIPILAEKAKTQFDLRIILPKGKFPPENTSRLPSAMPTIQKRVLPKVNVLIVLTEAFAVFCLPNRAGKIDYTGFTSTDPKFHKWCQDLYLYYWDKAKLPSSKISPAT
jgi:predicted transcriptional regulator